MGSCIKTKVDRVRPRVDTLLRFMAFNPVLCDQELSYDTTSRKFKVGDGITAWVDLPYNATDGTSTVFIEEGTNITITGSGTELDPYIINAPGSGGSGTQITDGAIITAITTNSNYNDAYGDPSPAIGGVWNTTIPVGLSDGDYYIEPIGTPDGSPRHKIECKKIGDTTDLTLIKTPYIQ